MDYRDRHRACAGSPAVTAWPTAVGLLRLLGVVVSVLLRDDTYCFKLPAVSVRGERLKALDRPRAESKPQFFVICAGAQ